MRSNLKFILGQIGRNLRESGTDVLLTWTANSGGAADPVTGQVLGGSSTTTTATLRAMVHAAEAKRMAREWGEIETGDLIVDFGPEAELDGKASLRFTIDGQVYEQAKTGGKLTKMWDAVVAGKRLMRTVLLRRAT